MPQPSSSIHPDCLHLRQPLPPQKMQLICTSALGSVNGKNDGKNRVLTAEPNSAFMAWSSVPFRSLKVMFGIHAQPFDLVKDRRVRRVRGVVAVHLAGNHDAHRRRLLLHRPHLHRRSVRAQQQPVAQRPALLVGDHQRVLRVARRMARAENSCSRSCSSRSRPPAPRPPNSPARQTPEQSHSSCA